MRSWEVDDGATDVSEYKTTNIPELVSELIELLKYMEHSTS